MTWSYLLPGQCQINLEQMGTAGGKYPPLIIQDGDFLYPTSQVFTPPPHLTPPPPLLYHPFPHPHPSTQVGEEAVLNIPEAASLELFCHGTKK